MSVVGQLLRVRGVCCLLLLVREGMRRGRICRRMLVLDLGWLLMRLLVSNARWSRVLQVLLGLSLSVVRVMLHRGNSH